MEPSTLIPTNEELDLVHRFATSLAIGLLIGLERERNPAAKAGLRTFALTALLGTLLALLAEKTQFPWLLIGGLLSVAAAIVGAYMVDRQGGGPGTTTQAALLFCYELGALVWYDHASLAVMLAIVITILLHFKPELHNISARLTRRDIQSILQFAVLSFVILPILPDKNFGPYQTLNPYQIWLMVVLISGLSLAGYVALNFVGQRYGAPLLGFFGGLVSSTATTLIYSRNGKNHEALARLSAAVIVIANLVVLVRLGVVSSIVAPDIASHILPVLASGLITGILFTFFWWRKVSGNGELPLPEITNPTEIKTALSFAALYALILLASAWLSEISGHRGLYLFAFASGLTDVDAISLSMLRLFDQGKLLPEQAVIAIGIAYLSNLVFKFGLIVTIGGKTLARNCAPAFAITAGGLIVALLAQSLVNV